MTARRLGSIARTLVATLIGVSAFVACPNPVPLPLAGWAEFQELLFVRVPGGGVNTGGGNFLTRRTDLSIDTRVGTYAVGAAYNSASGGWRWAHEMTYVGSTFVDESGASFDLTAVANGAAIPGTHWVRLDADSMKTKGGLVHDFSASGKLAAIHWLGFDYPRLRFTTQVVGGGTERVTAIDQCTTVSTCASVFTLAYTASAQLQTVTDRASRTASFTWDASGRLATAKDGLDNAKGWLGFRYEYSGTNLTAITSSENERVEYTYDTAARLLTAKKIGDGNPTSTFAYLPMQGSGYYLTRFTNPLSQVSNLSFDAGRRLFVLELAAVGETTSFQWNGGGRRVTRITRPDGTQTNFVITGDDATQVTEASGNVITISYAPNAIDPGSPNARPVDVVSDSVGLVLDRGYDGQGRLTSMSNGSGDATLYTWNTGSPSELASVQTPAGVLTTFSGYGEHGHPGSAAAGPQTASYTYDAVGNMLDGQDTSTELSPGMGGVLSRTFDADRNVATVLLENQVPTVHEDTMTLEARSDGLLKAIRPPYGGDTEFDYSATGRVLARREKANGAWVTTHFGYDVLDRMTSTELANGMRSEGGYDGAGRLQAVISKRSGVVEETLTRTFAAGRLTTSVDSVFSGSETYAYDSAGRVSTITYPGGERRELIYDVRSRVTTERFIDASEITLVELVYSYDLANRVTEIRRNPFDVLLVEYTYTNGFLTETTYGNGLRRAATIDTDFGLPATTVTTNAASQTLETTTNDLEAILVFRISTIAGTASDESFSRYSRWRINSTAQGAAGEFFKWDSLSNLRQGYTQELLYNAEANRLTQVRDIAAPQTVRHTYSYDAAGFVTNRDGVTLGYDATGAIASIGSVAAFDHDLSGRPVSRTLDGVTKVFRFGGAIAYSTSGNPIDMDLGEVVIKWDGTSPRYRHTDFRGNVLFVSRGNGTIEGQATYRGFGRRSVSGTLGERGFAQGFEIPSLGLVVIGPRVLDSDTGRFLSQDPVFNAVNLYAYAQGNPVLMWDPSGSVSEFVATVGGTAAQWGGAALGAAAGFAAAGPVGALVGMSLGGAIGLGAFNLAIEALDPEGARYQGFGDLKSAFQILTPSHSGLSGGGGANAGGGLGGGIQSGSGNPPGPDTPGWSEMHPEGNQNKQITICAGGLCVGGSPFGTAGSIYGLGSLNFSIALSFGGAMW